MYRIIGLIKYYSKKVETNPQIEAILEDLRNVDHAGSTKDAIMSACKALKKLRKLSGASFHVKLIEGFVVDYRTGKKQFSVLM